MRYIGLDIGGTKCAACIGTLDGNINIDNKTVFPTENLTPHEVLGRFSEFIENQADGGEIGGIGISCGGPLDSKRGVIMSPPSLPLWDNIEVVKYFKNRFNLPVYLQNDANAGAVAEWKYGAGRGSDNMVFITFGTGFGAGIIAGGRLITGANDNAGEVGHVRLTARGPEGYHKHGSAEGYCSGGGIKRLAQMMLDSDLKKGINHPFIEEIGGKDALNAKIIAEYARKGNDFCVSVYKKSGIMLGQILAVIMDIINPEIIAIGGVFMRSSDLLLPEAMKVIKREALPLTQKVCKIVPAALGESIGDVSALTIAKGDY